MVVVSATAYHYGDVIMDTMASQITSVTIVYSTVYSGADQRKHQSSVLLAFVRGPVNSPHKCPVTRKMFPFNDVIMFQEFADRVGIPYMETSVKNDDNVERAFLTLASSLLKNLPQTPKTRTIADPSIVQLCRQRLRSSGCCATGTRYRNHRIVKS